MKRRWMIGAVVMGIVAGVVLGGLSGVSTAPVRSQEPPLADRVRQLEDRMAAVEARLAALDGRGASSAPPAPSAPTASALLIDASGRGFESTDDFRAPSTRVTVCWEITDAAGRVNVVVQLRRSGGGGGVTSRTADRVGMDCFTANVESGGSYYVFVSPSDDSGDLRWRVTVQAA